VEARESLERSLAAAERLDDPPRSIAATNALALVASDEGDLATAIDLVVQALVEARRTGERHLEAALENNLADMCESAGRRAEAMEHLKSAAAAFADIAAVTDEPEPGIWMLESW
jgi:tetratricopeptide (TPR) repeat protein